MLLSTGERISCALCAMAINDLGHRAISLTGSQAGIVTDTSHTKARIIDVRADRIREALNDDLIVLVAGFQGVSTSRDVTTLGRAAGHHRGGAAAAIGAEVCNLHRRRRRVHRRPPGSPDRAQTPDGELRGDARDGRLGRQGAPAALGRIRADARSTDPLRFFLRGEPRYLCDWRGRDHGASPITAVTHSTEEARITLTGVPDRPGAAAAIFRALADANCNVDTIIQNEPREEGRDAEVSFTIAAEDLRAAERALQPIRDELGIGEIDTDPEIGKVSIIGAGMRSHPGVAAQVFETLAEREINIEMISTSPIKISCVIRSEAVPEAVQALAAAFQLTAAEIREERPIGQEAR